MKECIYEVQIEYVAVVILASSEINYLFIILTAKQRRIVQLKRLLTAEHVDLFKIQFTTP